jgi:hypothetical protein
MLFHIVLSHSIDGAMVPAVICVEVTVNGRRDTG